MKKFLKHIGLIIGFLVLSLIGYSQNLNPIFESVSYKELGAFPSIKDGRLFKYQDSLWFDNGTEFINLSRPSGGSMSWPSSAGIARYSGSSSWSTSLVDSSHYWNTAYGWGNHASAGYAKMIDTAGGSGNDKLATFYQLTKSIGDSIDSLLANSVNVNTTTFDTLSSRVGRFDSLEVGLTDDVTISKDGQIKLLNYDGANYYTGIDFYKAPGSGGSFAKWLRFIQDNDSLTINALDFIFQNQGYYTGYSATGFEIKNEYGNNKLSSVVDSTLVLYSKGDTAVSLNYKGLTMTGNLEYDLPHAAGNANDISSYSVGGTQNVYYKVNPSGMSWNDAEFITAAGDSVVISSAGGAGHYEIWVNIAASTTNANDKIRIRCYRNSAVFSPNLSMFRVLSNGSSTIIPSDQHYWYLPSLNVGDRLSIWVVNETGNRAIYITDFAIVVKKIPER